MRYPKLLIADSKNRVYDMPLEAAGMKAGEYFRMFPEHLVKLPKDSEIFTLPERKPVGYDPVRGRYVTVDSNPFLRKNEPCYAVAAFLAPGYTASYSPAYKEFEGSRTLPLFSYSAVVMHKGSFYAAGIRTDREKRQALRGMDIGRVRKNVKRFHKIFPRNRLVGHLETCALVYGCPAAKNFFLKRYECPLPVSTGCNANCIGCISYQHISACPVTQPRIKFIPHPEEIAEIAIFHIRAVRDPVVSFGQGCEGEPLTESHVIEKAISMIRASTRKGIINLNTNASCPGEVSRLFDAGLDSIRVSMNSAREKYYEKYYRPAGYRFKDVKLSIRNARRAGGFVSINYLVMPGFTDSAREVEALRRFLGDGTVDMIQWRNMNYDPLRYFRELGVRTSRDEMTGMETAIKMVKEKFPGITNGYFNPSRRRMRS